MKRRVQGRPGRQSGFIIRKKKLPYLNSNRPAVTPKPEEFLGHVVHGMKASDLEERLAYGHDVYGIPYEFRLTTLPRGLPGFKELDFLSQSLRGTFGISVEDTTFIHHGTTSADELQQAIIVDALRHQGIELTPMAYPSGADIIGVVTQRELSSKEAAAQFVKEHLL